MLELYLTGRLQLLRDAAPVPLPRSKKTRALLAYLVLSGRPQSRERLSSLFWDVADDPRAALRWSISKLRGLLDDDTKRVQANRDTVAIDTSTLWVDALAIKAAKLSGFSATSDSDLVALSQKLRGPLLEELELPDFQAYQAWCIAERKQFHNLHLELLETISTRVQGPAQLEATRGLLELEPGHVGAQCTLDRLLGKAPETTDDAPPPSVTTQQVRFCDGKGGVQIAYSAVGRGKPLVKTANWMTHLEHDWDSPMHRHLARELASGHQLIRYDQRGNGLSDRDVDELTLDAFVADLGSVIDAVGLDRVPLFGMSQGVPVALAYAAANPERVRCLVLLGGYAQGWGLGEKKRRSDEMRTLIQAGWGKENPAFRQMFTTLFLPKGNTKHQSWMNDLMKQTASPSVAARVYEAMGLFDVRAQLAKIQAPTLILHSRDDAAIPFEQGRRLAGGIPGAEFVPLPSANHLLLEDEPAWKTFVKELKRFLAAHG